MRWNAAEALTEIRLDARAAVSALTRALDDDEEVFTVWAHYALAKLSECSQSRMTEQMAKHLKKPEEKQ